MNDRHLDPPEEYELPECCSVEMDCDEEGNCICSLCGSVIAAPKDIEPPDDPRLIEGDYLKDQYDDREDEVDDYDYEADDRAFDASREK